MSMCPVLGRFLLPPLLALAAVPGAAAAFLIHGTITDSDAVLEPVFSFEHLAGEAPLPGPYTLAFLDSAGTVLHAVPLGTSKAYVTRITGCDLVDTKEFLVTVPVTEQLTARTAAIELQQGGRRLGALRATSWRPSPPPPELQTATPIPPGREPRATSLGKGQVRITWDAATHPALWVFTPGGEALREAKGGSVEVATEETRLILKLSDNLRTRTLTCEVKAGP